MAILRVYKARRVLMLIEDAMPIALGAHPVGHKAREGDGRTPEGDYLICSRNPKSKFHLSLGISYPNEKDAKTARKNGLIDEKTYESIIRAAANGTRPPWDTPLGGFIMLHGGGAESDWTEGCIALRDADMDILWERVEIGDRISIYP